MPEFAIVPIREAQASTIAGRQGKFMQEYIRYIRQISQGKAGKLHLGEQENLSPSDGGLLQQPGQCW